MSKRASGKRRSAKRELPPSEVGTGGKQGDGDQSDEIKVHLPAPGVPLAEEPHAENLAKTGQRRGRSLTSALSRPFFALPDVVRYEICKHLDPRSVLRLSMTAKDSMRKLPWKLLTEDLAPRILKQDPVSDLSTNNDWVVPDAQPLKDDATFYRLLAECTCIVCGIYCNGNTCFWFGHRMCRQCYATGARGSHFKLIPKAEAKVKYKGLDLSQFSTLKLRMSGGTTPILALWERQLMLASKAARPVSKK